jgi:hypothetical protein
MAPYPDDQEKFDDITATLSNSSDEKSTNTNTGGQQYDLTTWTPPENTPSDPLKPHSKWLNIWTT